MSAFVEEIFKKGFGGSKPSLKLTLKTKWCHSCGCCDDSWSCEQLKKCVTDKYLERKLWTLITFCYRKCMLPLQYLSDWCLHGIYIWKKFQRKNISNWVIIWIKFKVLQLLWGLYSALASSVSLAGHFRPRLSPDAQNRAFAKVAFKS